MIKIISALMLLLLIVTSAWAGGRSSGGVTHVSGYTRKDGTYVRPYDRRSAGGSSGSSSYNTSSTSGSDASYSSDSSGNSSNLRSYQDSNGHWHITNEPYSTINTSKETVYSEPSQTTTNSTIYSEPSNTSNNKNGTEYKDSKGILRDANGKIHRSESAKSKFKKMTGYPHGRPGYVIDHVVPLKRGGADAPSNMQWQTKEAAKAKDRWE